MAAFTNMQISETLAHKCGVAREALDVGSTVVDGGVDVPTPGLPEQEAARHRQALPFLEAWAAAGNVASWFRDAIDTHGAAINDQLAAARQVADYLDCRDFLEQTAKLSLLCLHQLRRTGFTQLSGGNWPPFSVQFSQQVLTELEDLDLSCTQLPADHLGPDRHIGPDLFQATVERLDADGTLCLDPITIRSVITWLGFQLAIHSSSYQELSVHEADQPYVGVSLPLQLLRKFRVASVLVTAKAHDQGWSSYPEDHGSTTNSWTFADLAVLSSQQPDSEPPLHRHERVYTNRHAVSEWQEHSTSLGSDTQLVQFINSWAEEQPGPSRAAAALPPPPGPQGADAGQQLEWQVPPQQEAALQGPRRRLLQGQEQEVDGQEGGAAGPPGGLQGAQAEEAQASVWQPWRMVGPVLQRLAGAVAGLGLEPSSSGQGAPGGGRHGAVSREVSSSHDGEEPGLVVQLRLRALYPGWMHYVQRGAVLVVLEHRT